MHIVCALMSFNVIMDQQIIDKSFKLTSLASTHTYTCSRVVTMYNTGKFVTWMDKAGSVTTPQVISSVHDKPKYIKTKMIHFLLATVWKCLEIFSDNLNIIMHTNLVRLVVRPLLLHCSHSDEQKKPLYFNAITCAPLCLKWPQTGLSSVFCIHDDVIK